MAMAMAMAMAMKGMMARQISLILAPGTAACITNRLSPKGGEMGLISKFMRKVTDGPVPNTTMHRGLRYIMAPETL